MKISLYLAAFALCSVGVSALKFPIKKVKRSVLHRRSGGASYSVSNPPPVVDDSSGSSDTQLDLSTVNDMIYITNITVGGIVYPAQLDTGSSDLWIKGPTSPLPNCNETTTTYNLTYGIGWAFGNVAYSTVQFADITVPSQALLDVSSANNPALSYNADGILGLGFTSLSTIDALVNATNSTAGRSLLYNLFRDNPSEPNFITFSLQRSTDSSDTVEGYFSIGEYESQYAAVMNSTSIPTWPVASPDRWNVLLDALIVGNKSIIPTTAVAGAPSNKAVVLLDSGTTNTYAPAEICQAIYGGVSGAQYDSSISQWRVPCSAEIDMALEIGGQVFPVHPLDVNPTSAADPTSCLGSFIPQSVAVGGGQFDWLVGDNFLRSVYTMYNYGDFDSYGGMINPYVKLLSVVDPDEASADFHNIRGGSAENNITYNAANSSETSSGGSTSITLSDDLANTLDKVGKYIPAMLAVMALNALVIIALLVVGLVLLVRKRGGKGTRARKAPGRLSPMPMNPRNSYVGGPAPVPHVYQPVSMALTEDTLAPPSPAFRSFENDNMKSGDRSSHVPNAYHPVSMTVSEDTFSPPNPAFHSFENDNMKSGDRSSGLSNVYHPVSMAISEDTLAPPNPSFHDFDESNMKPGDRPKSIA